jgi:type IV pilus assembly protein PilV
MVALIVLSVGLLGIARMESLALSNTSVANQRGLAAIEAASLAASMHVNRGYWTKGDPVNAKIAMTGTATSTTFNFTGAPNLAGAGSPDCTSAGTPPCSPASLAAYDLHQWGAALQPMLPNYIATITCGAVTPISCTIQLTWSENVVAMNAQEAQQQSNNPGAALQLPTYTLYVQP